MTWQSIALATAGVIGGIVSIIHGVLTQRLMVAPFETLSAGEGQLSAPVRRLVPALLQFSTFNWFLGGLALIAAALWFGRDARLVTGLLVGSSYLYAAAGNLWGTRAWHPGWMLMVAALILIVFGIGWNGDTGRP